MTNETLLHRQIHPSWVHHKTVSSQAFTVETVISSLSFKPSEKDEGKLSMYNGVKFSAEESFNHYTKALSSAGVLSLLVEEVMAEGLPINEDNTPFNGHTIIDFNSLDTKSKIEKKAKRLRNLAIERGWTHKI